MKDNIIKMVRLLGVLGQIYIYDAVILNMAHLLSNEEQMRKTNTNIKFDFFFLKMAFVTDSYHILWSV